MVWGTKAREPGIAVGTVCCLPGHDMLAPSIANSRITKELSAKQREDSSRFAMY